MDTYAVQQGDLAGVDIIGYRQDDGTIELGGGSVHPAFPSEVTLDGTTYTLEGVKENEWEGRAEVERADPSDSRLKICWGIYV